jgi:hypothetical protein
MSHPTDPAGVRDLTAEANALKVSATQDSSSQPSSSKVHISFTSLAQASIPNFGASKILGDRLKVTYVPDFFYLLDLSQKLFALAKQDKTLKRTDTISMYSFTLYVMYAGINVYFDAVHQTNPNPTQDLTEVLNIFRQNGFQTSEFPAILSSWITGIGKHLDVETKRFFVPYLPDLQQNGDYFDSYFYSPDVAHLLPNFRLAHITILLAAKNTPAVVPAAHRSLEQRLGNPLTPVITAAGTTNMRSKSYRVPGIKALLVQYEDDQLLPLLMTNMQKANWPDNLQRYLMLDAQLLSHLKFAVEPVFQHIDKFVINNVSPIGNSLTMTPLVHEANQDDVIPGRNVVGDPANAVTQVIYDSYPSFSSRIKTKYEVINGNVDYATLTPIVRIANEATAVIIAGHVYNDPQHAWYSSDVEFQTPIFTLNESRSYFRRND